MATTNFTAGTVVASSWLNDVDIKTYEEWVNVKMYGAVGDGVTDDTAAIQAAVTAAASGSGVVYFPKTSASYYFANVNVDSNTTIFGLGQAKLKLKPLSTSIGTGFHALFKASSKTKIVIDGFVIDGNTSAQTPDASNIDRYSGVYFVDCSDLTISNLLFIVAPYGNASIRVRQGSRVDITSNTVVDKGIYYNAYSGTNYSVTIDNNNTTGCGISINDDTTTQTLFGWAITNNRIRASNATDEVGIGVRASEGVIKGNTIIGGYFGMTISAGGATFQQHDVLVQGNYVAADSGSFNPYGIEHFAYNITIDGNTLVNCSITTSSATGKNVAITNNMLTCSFPVSAATTAISFSSGTFDNISIRNNTVDGHGSFCVVACPVNTLDISHNIASLTDYAGTSFGIKLQNAGAAARVLDGCVIIGNQIRNASKTWLWFIGNGANTLTVNDMRAVFNPTLGTSAAILVDSAASLGSTSMHAFNELVYATFQNTPTSAPAASGSVWRDAADSNRAKIVP